MSVAGAGLRDNLALYGLVAAGAAIGGVLRAGVGLAALGAGFPWGTLAVNVAGSLLIGFYATLTGPGGLVRAGNWQRQFVMSGVCGGFTTFSVFSLETFHLAAGGQMLLAGTNVGVSVVTWLAAVWLGHALAARFTKARRGGLPP